MIVNTKVLILLSNYLPGNKIGGPLTSVKNIIDNLSAKINFYVITSDRDMGDPSPYPNIPNNVWIKLSNHSIMYIEHKLTQIFVIVKQLRILKPDILYLNSFFNPTFSIFLVMAQKLSIIKVHRIILASRGELLDEALLFKKHKKKFYISFVKFFKIYRNVTWHATSEIEKSYIVKNLNISIDKILVARNISSKTNLGIKNINFMNEANRPLNIVYLARISKDKNIQFTFDVLSKVKSAIAFDIYGPIEDVNIWDVCLMKIINLPQNIKVTYKGVASKVDVQNILANYDLFFLPTFAENYGHSIAEALSVGTPVLISDKTPWRNLVSKGLGWDINLNNIDDFIQTIENFSAISPKLKEEQRAKRVISAKKILQDPEIYQENLQLFIL